MTEPQSASRRRRFTGKRAVVVRRLWRTAEAQVSEIERRLIDETQQPEERERDARTLAVLARTLRDLDALDGDNSGRQAPDDDTIPRDVDELRRSLSQKLEALVAERQAGLSCEGE
jgi:hypothetical protein